MNGVFSGIGVHKDGFQVAHERRVHVQLLARAVHGNEIEMEIEFGGLEEPLRYCVELLDGRVYIGSMNSTSQSRRGLLPNACSNWARRLKRELELAGYKVTVLDPARAAADKKTGRRRDAELLSSRRATPQELQQKNSVFHGEAKRFRILDYGGLNGEN